MFPTNPASPSAKPLYSALKGSAGSKGFLRLNGATSSKQLLTFPGSCHPTDGAIVPFISWWSEGGLNGSVRSQRSGVDREGGQQSRRGLSHDNRRLSAKSSGPRDEGGSDAGQEGESTVILDGGGSVDTGTVLGGG